MMMVLLLLKSRIKNFYEGHYKIVRGILKACISFFALFIVTRQLNFSDLYSSYLFMALMALLSSVAPDFVSSLVVGLVVCAEIFHVSVLLGICVLTVLVIYFLIFGRLSRYQDAVILLVPVLSVIHIDYGIPIIAALFASPSLVPALFMGVLLQYMMESAKNYAMIAGVTGQEDVVTSFHYLVEHLLGNRRMLITMIAFTVTFLCVYFVRRRQNRHSSYLAILVGGVVLVATELLCNIMLQAQANMGLMLLQVTGSALIACVVQFFRITLDYHGTKKLQFEDDEYYYYVTAVPKFKVTVVDRTVTRILSEREEGRE